MYFSAIVYFLKELTLCIEKCKKLMGLECRTSGCRTGPAPPLKISFAGYGLREKIRREAILMSTSWEQNLQEMIDYKMKWLWVKTS